MSDALINPADSPERRTEKLLSIVDVLMRQAEQTNDDRGAAYAQFQRAALLEEQVRERTMDLERALDLLNESNARLSEANRQTESARRNLAGAIETVQDGFALFDSSDVLVMFNSRFATFMPDIRAELTQGITFEHYVELVSRSRYLALTSGETADLWADRRKSRHHERHVIFNVHLINDRWIQVSEHNTSDGGTVILQTDVTDIILNEREERGRMLDDQAKMIGATLEHISQGVCIFDGNLRLAGWNKRLGHMLGIPMTRLRIGASAETLLARFGSDLPFGDRMTASRLLAWVALETPRPALSFELKRGNQAILDVLAEEMPDRGFVMSFTDITRERDALTAITRANETLEARVVERTLDLEDALSQAERANAARSRFVAAASHDLLQPLSAAKLFVASAGDGVTDPATQAVLGKAQNALLSVESILGALLDISRLESGRAAVDIAPVPLGPLLAQLTDEFLPSAQAKGIALTVVPCKAVVESDPTYLRRILQNLIGNAIRYTKTGRVLVGPRKTASGIRLEVRDTGPGIPVEEQQAIFREFHRVGGSASASVGMGLGLAIVDRACAQLGHPLDLWSHPGKGTCFSVELPRSQLRAANSFVPRAVPAGTGESLNSDSIVLLVENDEELRRAMCLLLEGRGVSVIEAASGEEALALLGELGITPDILMVDQQLGEGMDGIDTILELRAGCGPQPARLVTANRTQAVRTKAERAGIKILFKPIDPQEIDRFLATPE
ncbi:hybrid sensor histidine kinase/response regulator [Aquimixticola soesokkakensis]|uniref:hybrid sensor histidine kinase/response regulator n=1 Tax=Aquimixticola soesokkakensis TaxID=1519096 RepID=UPI000A26E2BA|nr:PAS-domain containing protein [Aquimixticola soesokkakensis]